jgi:tetratricopeptide (TPR) repeat protein
MICAQRSPRSGDVHFLLFAVIVAFFLGCARPTGFGIGGQYNVARLEFVGRSGNFDKAIVDLEYVVSRDPFYKDSLTLLGRAYYRRGRYKDAFQVLQRALAVKSQDEIAWVALGLTQLRLGDDRKGMESLKGGLTLLSKLSENGYKGIEFWDRNGLVRNSLRKTVFLVAKGPDEKQNIIQSGELLLANIDREQWQGTLDQDQDRRINY